VALGSDDPKVRRVCTKGCNRLLKNLKNKDATVESKMYDIVTCQAEKRVICEPIKASQEELSNNNTNNTNNTTSTISSKGNSCKSTSTLEAQALCPFSPELWNLGATCISNNVHKDSHPQCPYAADAKVIASIKTKCRKAEPSDEHKCSRLAMSY